MDVHCCFSFNRSIPETHARTRTCSGVFFRLVRLDRKLVPVDGMAAAWFLLLLLLLLGLYLRVGQPAGALAL
jgi:hypothetical protein